MKNRFSQQYKATIGADFYQKDIIIDDAVISVQFWDTGKFCVALLDGCSESRREGNAMQLCLMDVGGAIFVTGTHLTLTTLSRFVV